MMAAALMLEPGETMPPEIGSLGIYRRDWKEERYDDEENYTIFHKMKTSPCKRTDFYLGKAGDGPEADAKFFPTEKTVTDVEYYQSQM